MMRKIRHLWAMIMCVLVCGAVIGRADVITSHMYEQWGNEILSQIDDDFGRYDGLYQNSTTQTFPDYAWGQGVMFHALNAASKIDPSYLPKARQNADKLRSNYWCSLNGTSGFNAGSGGCGDRYYDDNAWIALALIELYQLSDCPKYLDWAQDTVVFCMTGENAPTNSPGGGIRWHESNATGASVCSTAPTILSNLLLYQITGIESYKTDGLRLYNWIMDTDNGLRYSSGIFHEYNQGALGYQTAVMTQAATQLYLITGDTAYLTEAQNMADAMVSQFINSSSHSLGQTGKWGGHDMTNAYVELYEVDGNPYWLDVATGYLDHLYNNWQAGGRYAFHWNGAMYYENGQPIGVFSDRLIDNASVARAYWKMASAPGGQTPVSYAQVTNRAAGRCLRPYNSGTSDNTNVIIYDKYSIYTSERWTLKNLRNGYFNIRSVSSDKSLQLYNNQTADNTNTVIYTTNLNTESQQWALIDLENGYFNIQNKTSGKSIKPKNGATGNDTNVVIVPTDLSNQSQQWQITNITPPRSLMPYISVNNGNWWQMNDAIIDADDTVSLKAEGPDSGTWQWEGPHGFTATGKEITITEIQPYQAGFYTVIHTSTSGTESFTAFHIKVPAVLTMYQHIDYNQASIGWVAGYGVGAYTTADIVAAGGANNDMTSFKIEPGYTVTFYDGDNFTGGTLVRTASTTYVGNTWNDRISSMVIEGQPAPVAYWQFNDPGDTTAEDASGNGHDGTLTNMDLSSSWTLGKQCTGLAFDGVDDYVEIAGFKGITGGQSRTCTAWIKTDTTGAIMSWGNTAPTGGDYWYLLVNYAASGNPGALHVSVMGGNVIGTTDLRDGQWHHIAVVLESDGTPDASELLLYVDGRPEAFSYVGPHRINTMADTDVYIGSRLGGTSNLFTGTIDEIRIYHRALSFDKIYKMYTEHALMSDFEPDGAVDLNDFAAFSGYWQNSENCEGDLTCDCIVDIDDLMFFTDEWLRSI